MRPESTPSRQLRWRHTPKKPSTSGARAQRALSVALWGARYLRDEAGGVTGDMEFHALRLLESFLIAETREHDAGSQRVLRVAVASSACLRATLHGRALALCSALRCGQSSSRVSLLDRNDAFGDLLDDDG